MVEKCLVALSLNLGIFRTGKCRLIPSVFRENSKQIHTFIDYFKLKAEGCRKVTRYENPRELGQYIIIALKSLLALIMHPLPWNNGGTEKCYGISH